MSTELERFDPENCTGRIAYEHLHRYAICAQFVAGKSILDIACGSGYGTTILASKASKAVGLDIDEQAIRKANASNTASNVSFIVGDAYQMPFDEGQFDIVVANEMIEHVHHHDQLLREARRVLKPDGCLLISTPNKSVYNRYKAPNRFHVSEMERYQFADLLEDHFSHVKMIGQRMALVSAAFALGRRDAVQNSAVETLAGEWAGSRLTVGEAPLLLRDPEYLVAICSESPLDGLAMPSSVYFMPNDDLWIDHEKVMAWASQLHEEDEQLRTDLASAQSRELEHRKRIESAVAEAAQLNDKLEDTRKIAALEKALRSEKLEAVSRDRDEVARLFVHLLRECGIEIVGHGKDDIVAALFALQRKIIAQEALAAEADRFKAERDGAREDASRLNDDAERLQEDVRREREASALDREAADRMRSDIDSWHRGLEATKFQARSLEERMMASSQVRKALAARESGHSRTGSWPSNPLRGTRLFDGGYIKWRRPDLADIRSIDYVRDRGLFEIDPHPLFSGSFYLGENPDVAEQGVNPLVHYLKRGWREGRSPSPFFDNDAYLAANPDVLSAGTNPLVHYIEYGAAEGRAANPFFDGKTYLRNNPDVAKDGLDPFIHWVGYGQYEGREAPLRNTLSNRPFLSDGAQASAFLRSPAHISFPDLTAVGDDIGRAPSVGSERVSSRKWPPVTYEHYSLPQLLRDVIIERHGEGWIPTFHFLFGAMEAFKEKPGDFANSAVGEAVLAQSSMLSALVARQTGSRPEATIIIPVYNNFLDTSLCILSLLQTQGNRSFEILVADDGSSDATEELIPKIGGCVRYIRQTENLGFLGNCNTAAEHATGDNIVLLNNDTLVLPGWLDGLLKPLQLERVGLVGSKLLNWDGTLQEAGGIFWRDGSAWNFGRGMDPRSPEFNYLKDIDYCSGASIAISAKVWREVGGFDPIFTPAYCEDSDLAFRLRAKGYRTLYSPSSEVVHHEGRSHGRDVASGVKAFQVANNERLLDRWRHVLEREHYENAENVLRARDRSFDRPHVLVVDHYVPQWEKDAGSRTIYEFIRVLLETENSVTFWPDNLYYDPIYAPQLQDLGVEVIFGAAFVDGFENFIRERGELYDMVLLSRPHVATNYIDAIRRHSAAAIVYYGHDLHFKREMAQRKLNGQPVEDDAVAALKAQEVSVGKQSDLVLYPSREEASLMGKLVGKMVPTRAIPAYRFDDETLHASTSMLKERRPATDPIQLLFVGGFAHPPNVDAIRWFVSDVLPLFEEKGRQVILNIVGSKAGKEIEALRGSNVKLFGFVPDVALDRIYQSTDVVIAPLRYGAGVKGKVIEAMARGVPIATTDAGSQGISGRERLLFVGNTPEEFVDAVLEAASEKGQVRAAAALDFIKENYSTDAIAEILLSAIAKPQDIETAAK